MKDRYEIKTRRPHRCEKCGGGIPAGTEATMVRRKRGEYFYEHRDCGVKPAVAPEEGYLWCG